VRKHNYISVKPILSTNLNNMKFIPQNLKEIPNFILYSFLFIIIFWVSIYYLQNPKSKTKSMLKEDAWLTGSIMKNRTDGFASAIPFTRFFIPKGEKKGGGVFNYNISTYKKAILFDKKGEWYVYKSALRSPVTLFTFLDNFLYKKLNSHNNLKIFKIISCFFFAVTLSFFVLWIKSPMSAYWTKFLPLVLGLWILRYEERKKEDISNKIIAVYIFIVIFLIQSNSYENTTMVLMSGILPFFYYYIKNQWKIKKFFTRLTVVSFSSLFAFFLLLTLHFAVLSQHLKSVNKAKEHFIFSFLKRSHLSTENLSIKVNPNLENCLQSSTSEVIKSYINNESIIWKLNVKKLLMITIASLSLFFTLISFNLFKKEKILKVFGLVTIQILAFIGVIAGLIVFKSHAACHMHIDFIFWCIPFSTINLLLIVVLLQESTLVLWSKLNTKLIR